MRRAVVSLLLIAVLGVSCSGGARTKAAKGPKLVVLIVIDQLPMWVFERDKSHFTGGLARMLREGAFAVGELPYANPYTAPGHAAIGTGAPPSVTGVLGNTWYRRKEGRERDAEYDPDSPVFSVGLPNAGVLTDDNNGSSKMLRVEGLADTLRKTTKGRAHSVAIGLKARASTFVVGKFPDVAVWYEAAAGGMTTSKAYAAEPPRWLVELAATSPATRYFRKSWTPLDPAMLAKVTRIPDNAPGEGSAEGLGTTFPHDLALSGSPAKAMMHTPFADEIVLETAYAAIDALELGKDDVPDLLAICFNAHDYAGHLWGPDSWEVLDLTMRLDAALGTLFTALDDKLGAGRWAAVLTSDHGATPVVERGKPGATRVTSDRITSVIDGVFASQGPGPWVAKVSSSNVYFTPSIGKVRDQEGFLVGAGHALEGDPGIARAGPTSRLAGNCEERQGMEQAICYSIVDGESGELYVLARAGSLITDYRTGTHHDAPYDDNRRVPILVLAPGVSSHQDGAVSILQVAPTVAALLGIPAPPSAKLPPLFGLR